MATKPDLLRYEAAYKRWLKAKSENDPLVHQPTEAEFNLASEAELWAAEMIRRKVERE